MSEVDVKKKLLSSRKDLLDIGLYAPKKSNKVPSTG